MYQERKQHNLFALISLHMSLSKLTWNMVKYYDLHQSSKIYIYIQGNPQSEMTLNYQVIVERYTYMNGVVGG